MLAGVLTETLSGERRVALVPAVLAALAKAGVSVVIQSGAGASAGFLDAAYAEKGAEIAASAAGRRVACGGAAARAPVAAVNVRRPAGPRADAIGTDAHRLSRSAQRAVPERGAGVSRRHGVLDGADAAHHARAEHGRAVVDGDHRGLQGRAARGEHAAAHVPDAHDGRRHDHAGARVRHRRGRRGPAGDLHRAASRRARRGVRRAPGREGAGAERRREVRGAAARGLGRRRQGRLREGAGRVVLPASARGDDEGRRHQRRRDHDGGDSGQAIARPRHRRRWSRGWRPAR